MIALAALLLLQAAAPSAGTEFVCEKRDGTRFVIAAPAATAGANADESERALYRTTLRDDLDMPDVVIDGRPDMMSLIWQPEDGSETTLDMLDYNPATGVASYRMRHQTSPDAPIVTTTFFDGHCRTDPARGGDAVAEGRIAR